MPLLAGSKESASKSAQGIPAQQEIVNKVYEEIYQNAVLQAQEEKENAKSPKALKKEMPSNPKMKPLMKADNKL